MKYPSTIVSQSRNADQIIITKLFRKDFGSTSIDKRLTKPEICP